MPTATPKRLAQAALTSTLTTVLYTVPASTGTIIKEVVISNTSTSAVPVTLRAAGTGVANTLFPATSVPANSTVVLALSTVLAAGETITGGAATASVVGVTISGVEVA